VPVPAAPVPAPEPAGPLVLLDYDPLFDDADEDFEAENEVYDPFETTNRSVYRFNRQVSRFVWDPVTTGYRFVVPTPARRALRRVLNNLNAPIYIANHLLQLDPLAAVETLGALAMNATFGIGGLFDTASGVGFALNPTDFGETLGRIGVGPGPYLMFPFLGPTTLRDGAGFIIDRGFHPATYFFPIPVQLVGYGGVGFAALEAAHDDLSALEDSALDPYAVLRSAYIQARQSSIAALRDRGREPEPREEPGASLASGEHSL
jgi:phospholipid-binding lipoprotein MlaA